MLRTVAALIAALGVAACASAPLVPPSAPPPPAGPSFEQKMSWILRLEDRRILHDAEPAQPAAPAPASAPTTPGGKTLVPAAVPPPPPPPDLLRLLRDDEARIRRRAALAVGRVGLPEGAPGLLPLLADADAEVRQMAAFSLGLIGTPGAREPLVLALRDPSPLVRGSAAEALGLLGDPASADAVAEMARVVVDSGALAEPPGDDADVRRDTPASAFRLALVSLVRLKASGALASVVLDGTAQPRSTWWPVAFALERIGDARAGPALLRLAGDAHPYTRVFAIRGLGALKIRDAVPLLLPLVDGRDRVAAIEAIHALGLIGDRSAGPALMKIVQAADADAARRAEAVSAVGGLRPDGAFDTLLDVLGDPSPLVRAAAIGSLARLDPEGFVTVLAGIDPDPHWSVRVALAAVLGTLTPEAGLPRLRAMLSDSDTRVLPAVLRSLARLRAPEAGRVLVERLAADDVVVRKAAADALRALKPEGGIAALATAYEFGRLDTSYAARAAALDAAAAYGADAAMPMLQAALADHDWAVRRTAASWLRVFDPASDAPQRIRPALSASAEFYQTPRLVDPSVSTQVYIDTDRGSIQLELAVLDAPLTVENFVTLARKGFFNGLSFQRVLPGLIQGGEPRGDGEGGPGYTMRDEVNQRPVLRGAVAMAADAVDAAGSQFLIARAPLPDLDARVTVFARVVAGMEVVDDIQPWDVIRRVRIWDGETPR